MAEQAVLRQRNYDAAIQYYKEALTFNEDDEVTGSKYYILFHSTWDSGDMECVPIFFLF